MKRVAVEKAKIRLMRAKSAAHIIALHNDLIAVEDAWSQFLTAANTIFSLLEQGSKGNQKSERWFENVKHVRKTDPLLSYLKQARNVDEHTIERTTYDIPGSLLVLNKPDSPPAPVVLNSGPDGRLIISHDPQHHRVLHDPPSLRLSQVIDRRYRTIFPVPTAHFGSPMEPTPRVAADLGVAYLTVLLDEASELSR